jgi:hypothetical protein
MTEDFDCDVNRDREVTDEGKSARRERTIRCKAASLKSVCRDFPGVALAAKTGPVYRLRQNRCVHGVQLLKGRRGLAEAKTITKLFLGTARPRGATRCEIV